MKIQKISETKGKLQVINNVGRLEELEFELDTLFYWYPCNPRYDYKLSSKRKKLYITVLDSNPELGSAYGVDTCKGRAVSDIACFYTDCWYNPEVWEENEELFKFAERCQFPVPTKEYTLEEVQQGITNVENLLDYIFAQETKERANEIRRETDKEIKERHTAYFKSDREDRASFILQHSSTETQKLYARLGEIYTMLSAMRKVVS